MTQRTLHQRPGFHGACRKGEPRAQAGAVSASSLALALIDYCEPWKKSPTFHAGPLCLFSQAARQGLDCHVIPAPSQVHDLVEARLAENGTLTEADLAGLERQPPVAAFLEGLAAQDPLAVGFTAYEKYLNLIELLIRLIRRRLDAYVLVGGPLAGAMGPLALELLDADFVVSGEAEFLLPGLLQALQGWRPSTRPAAAFAGQWPGQPIFAAGAGQAGLPPERVPQERLESLDLDFALALDTLLAQDEHYQERPFLSYVSSRGCPHGCIFCSSVQGKRYRRLSAGRVLADLERIQGLAAQRLPGGPLFTLAFCDDNFLLERPRALEILRGIRRRGLHGFFQFSLLASINTLFAAPGGGPDQELLEALGQANVRSITFGTDNFVDAELRRLGKAPYGQRHIRQAVAALEQAGIYNIHYCILSNPRTQAQDIRDNLAVVLELNQAHRHFLQLGPILYMSPYFGTPVWRELAADPEAARQATLPLRLLFADKKPGFFLADRILPRDPLARDLLAALEEGDFGEDLEGIPCHYDFGGALRLVDEIMARDGRARAGAG